MTINLQRRQFISGLGILFAGAQLGVPAAFAQSTETLKSLLTEQGNFHGVYDNASLKDEFRLFLTNVFHLYPEDKLHGLISESVKNFLTDRDIYKALQPRLADISPVLKDLTHSVPALRKQKAVMLDQTLTLLDHRKKFSSYLEVGSTGRYLDSLESRLDIGDERYFIAERTPTYSPADMVDRGQIAKAGEFISLANYRPAISKTIGKNSLDLVCVYIGFHHCPIPLRSEFISTIRDVMKPNAQLILRDHDVNSVDMWHMVALAHDVFNMGTLETLDYNETELRNFYSLDYLQAMMRANGFKTDGRRLLQEGDPTHNALMVYTKA